MTLAYQVDSIEGLDESIAGLYEQGEDGYRLKVEGLPQAEDPVELKNTLTKVRQERKQEEREKKAIKNEYSQKLTEMQEQLEKYSAIDPEEYRNLKDFHSKFQEDQEKRKMEEAEAQKDWDALKTQMAEKHQQAIAELESNKQKEIESYADKIAGLSKSLHKSLVETAYTKEITDAKGNLKLLTPHVAPYLFVNEEVDQVTGTVSHAVRVRDDNGKVKYNPSTGEPMSIRDLVTEYKENPDFKSAFEWEKKAGGSDSSGNVKKEATSDNPWSKDGFNLTRQGQILRSDPSLAARLKAEVGK